MDIPPGWKSAESAETIHDWFEYLGIIALLFAVIFDFAAWKWINLETAHQLHLMGNISLGCLVVFECFGWPYGRRAAELRKIEAAYRQRETKALQGKLEENEKKTSDIINNRLPRQITEEDVSTFKSMLSQYAGQKFQTIVTGGIYENDEAVAFARQIEPTLRKCGWIEAGVGLYSVNLAVENWNEINSGISLLINGQDMVEMLESGVNFPAALNDLTVAMRAIGIQVSHFTTWPKEVRTVQDAIVIIIARKPSKYPK